MNGIANPSNNLTPGLHRLDEIPDDIVSDLVANFQSGRKDLDNWLQKQAQKSERLWTARTFLLTGPDSRLDGYFCLSSATLMRDKMHRAAERKGMPGHVPAILLGRLAVAEPLHGQGIGRVLMAHALEQACRAAHGPAAAAMILVHPIDAMASRFYGKFDFRPLQRDEPSGVIEPAMYLPISLAAKLAIDYRQK